MSSPVRYPFGVTTVNKQAPLGSYGLPDPTGWYTYFDDFNRFAAAEWTVTTTEAGSGAAAEALTDAAYGCLLITNDDADNDADFFQKVGESFLPTAGKRLFFKMRFKVSDATDTDWIAGLYITDTTPLAADGDGVTDGIFFQKDDGDTNVDFYVQKDSTTGQLTSTAVTTAAADDTFMELAFAFDGKRYVSLFKDGANVADVDLTTTLATYLPDTELTIGFGLVNGAAAAKTMTIDYIFAAQER